jgi:hypothetical protein
MSADGYGTIDRPVPLDPFTWLTEVHWTGTFLMVSIAIKTISTPQGERGTGPGPAFVEPHSEAFTSQTTPSFDPLPPKVYESRGSDFTEIPSGQVSVSGMPEAPAPTSFDNWKVNGLTDGGSRQPFVRWLAPTGSHPDISLPSKNSWFTGLTANGELVAQAFISDPQPIPVGGDVPLWATFDPALAQQNTFALDVHGISATYKDRTYHALALRVLDQTETNTGQLQVLLKRQPGHTS